MDGIKKMLVRDQLYREEISGKITLSKEEVRKAFIDCKTPAFSIVSLL